MEQLVYWAIEIIKIPIKIYRWVIDFYFLIFNFLSLKAARVSYSTFPQIIGKIQLKNKGILSIGRKVTFNSQTSANYVGIYKICTIAVQKNAKLLIGDYSGFSGVSIYCSTYIKIGSHVNCGGNVAIWDTDFHPLQKDARRKHEVAKIRAVPVVIEDDVFIGANSIVLKGVHIGQAAVIGAGSIVTGNIPANEIWAGNPARFIRKINEE